jgi:hypothetical protein
MRMTILSCYFHTLNTKIQTVSVFGLSSVWPKTQHNCHSEERSDEESDTTKLIFKHKLVVSDSSLPSVVQNDKNGLFVQALSKLFPCSVQQNLAIHLFGLEFWMLLFEICL